MLVTTAYLCIIACARVRVQLDALNSSDWHIGCMLLVSVIAMGEANWLGTSNSEDPYQAFAKASFGRH